MTKQEAQIELDKGAKITHRYFEPNEYITQEGEHIVTEEGHRQKKEEFWRFRTSIVWETDWELFENQLCLNDEDKADDFWVQCNVCNQQLKNWTGSTTCCGSIAYLVENGEKTNKISVFASIKNGPLQPLVIDLNDSSNIVNKNGRN